MIRYVAMLVQLYFKFSFRKFSRKEYIIDIDA